MQGMGFWWRSINRVTSKRDKKINHVTCTHTSWHWTVLFHVTDIPDMAMRLTNVLGRFSCRMSSAAATLST